jgi:hypothetical protein
MTSSLQIVAARVGARRCEPIFAPGPLIAIEAAIGGAGGDALIDRFEIVSINLCNLKML